MRNSILTRLKQIEKEENVSILYACESGSRAWGFPSKDSDYDVRFIYIHPIDWYLSIFPKSDVIELPLQNSLDFSGWDLKKAPSFLPNPTRPSTNGSARQLFTLKRVGLSKKCANFLPSSTPKPPVYIITSTWLAAISANIYKASKYGSKNIFTSYAHFWLFYG
jgi:hypothetical protein